MKRLSAMNMTAIVELCDQISEIKIKASHCLQGAKLCTLDEMMSLPRKDFRRWRNLSALKMTLEQSVRVRDAWETWTQRGSNVTPSSVSGFLYSDKLCCLDRICEKASVQS